MSAAIQPVPAASISPAAELLWRLSVEQYHAMIDAGILTDDDPIELLGGYLVSKMPKKPQHRLSNRLVREALERLLGDGWYVDSQEPITTTNSEPEPDVMVVRGEPRQYAERHPGPQDLALVVEISDATLRRDQTLKKELYAQAGIAVYWIVNLPESRVEVYTGPSKSAGTPDYRWRSEYGAGDAVPVSIQGVEVGRLEVADLLP
jgi:Uma2 family endonuclease